VLWIREHGTVMVVNAADDANMRLTIDYEKSFPGCDDDDDDSKP
jgi:hypothetical protein